MSLSEGLAYIGLALVYALVATGLGMALAALAGRPLDARGAALVLATLLMVFLGLHPFPDPAAVECRAPILRPFAFLEDYIRLWRAGAPARVWLQSTGTVAPVMNFVICLGIGLLLHGKTRRVRVALFYGLGLSGFIELSQLSGLWGFYPCPYRHFELDDLILNVGGVVAGFGLAHGLARLSARLSAGRGPRP